VTTRPDTTGIRAIPSFRRMTPRRPAHLRWGAAVLVWLAALGLTLLFAPQLERANFVFFWLAVLFAAWYAGLAAALLAAIASVLAVHVWMVEPAGTFGEFAMGELMTFGIFVVASTLVSGLAARLGREQRRLANATEELATYAQQQQEQAVELEQQMEEAQVLTEELEATNRELLQALAKAERAQQEAELANRAKSEFLSTMSHELRTPLNAIGGYAELLEMGIHGPLTDAQRAAIHRLQRSQHHLLALINDVLNLARLEAGRVEYRIEDVPVDEALAEMEALIAPQAASKRLTYEYRRAGSALRVRADRERLQQVVVNLLSNAVKFTPPGGRITMDTVAHADRVEIRVADTGCGIAPDVQEAIFQPFVQVERGYTRTSEGTGLGLSISRDLARAMGGELAVTSRVGDGSTFTLTLLRAAVTDGDGDGAGTRDVRAVMRAMRDGHP
jgi:signal transduction histidine kinase